MCSPFKYEAPRVYTSDGLARCAGGSNCLPSGPQSGGRGVPRLVILINCCSCPHPRDVKASGSLLSFVRIAKKLDLRGT